jgi:hypothetical protein
MCGNKKIMRGAELIRLRYEKAKAGNLPEPAATT